MMRLLSILFFLLSQIILIAQNKFQPTGNLKKDQMAVTLLENQKELELAANYYPLLLGSQKLSPSQQMQIGLNYLKIAQFEEAMNIFKLLVNKYYSKYPLSRYYLATSYFRNAEFDLARDEFKTFINNYSFESDSFENKVKFEMNECDSMKIAAQKKSNKILLPLDSLAVLSSPSQDKQGNLYLIEHTASWSNEERTYLSTQQSIIVFNSDTTKSRNVFSVNNKYYNDVFISEDGNFIVYTETETTDKVTNNKIFYCRKTMDGWDKPIPFSSPINANGYNSKNPTLIKIDRDYYLTYTSDKPGGYGGFDLYFTELNAEFNVVNDSLLSTQINTSFDEISPFFNKQNATLYYSSNSPRDNFGGFDIFSYKKGVADRSINIGLPYNSGADDCFYRVFDQDGYLVSNRNSSSNKSNSCVYSFEIAKNNMKIVVASNYMELTNYELSIDENSLRIYNSDTSQLHLIGIEQNRKYKIKVSKDNYLSIDTNLTIGNLEEGESISVLLFIEPIISIEGKVYFVDYDSSAPKIKQCVVELIDLSTNTDRVLYSTIINKQNRKYSFLLPTDKQVKLKVKSQDYNTYDTTFVLQNFKSPGGFINNIQLHQIQKNNIIFLDSMFVLDDEIRTYNDFDVSIKSVASSFNKNEDIKAELTIQLITSDYSKVDFVLPSAIEDIINKYFTQKIYINKQLIRVKSTARNQDWYKLYLTYK